MRQNTRKELHPGAAILALFSGGDLPWREMWRLRRHVNRCDQCEHKVAEFRAAKAELKREAQAETLTGFEAIADWSVLEREMLGNIAVGVAAARAIDKVSRGRSFLLKGTILAGFTILFAAGWATHIPSDETAHLATSLRQLIGMERTQISGPFLKTTPDGIAVRAQGATLTIIHPPSAIIGVSGPESVSARYIDEDTGEVTITKVYAQ